MGNYSKLEEIQKPKLKALSNLRIFFDYLFLDGLMKNHFGLIKLVIPLHFIIL